MQLTLKIVTQIGMVLTAQCTAEIVQILNV